jgi:protein-tyrosine phosphatase
MGNICRSPTAEAVMRALAERAERTGELVLDSAGLEDYHVGEPADARAQEAARRRGYPMTGTARQFSRADFDRFDYVIAMDRGNARELARLAPSEAARGKIHLLRSFDPGSPAEADVPDPYYGGPRGFEEVLDLCEAGCRGLLDHLR